MYEIAKIPFQQTQGFSSIRDEKTGKIYVVPKSICESFGIEWSGQQKKLVANVERWGYKKISITLPGDDRKREVVVIPDRKVRTWICGINTEKVKAEVRPQLEAFQDECDRCLYDYWTKGMATNPRYQTAVSDDIKEFIGNIVGTAVEKAVQATVIAIREENKHMMQETVRATLSEIRSEEPLYRATQKWDIIERMHAAKALPQEQLVSSQQAILNMLIPGTTKTTLKDKNLTHASDFLHEKSLQGYKWAYKTLESAAAQLTRTARKIWEGDNYEAFKESITLKSGRTVSAYVFPVEYAQKAFERMEENNKFYKEN